MSSDGREAEEVPRSPKAPNIQRWRPEAFRVCIRYSAVVETLKQRICLSVAVAERVKPRLRVQNNREYESTGIRSHRVARQRGIELESVVDFELQVGSLVAFARDRRKTPLLDL
jgi:hypothetical protein